MTYSDRRGPSRLAPGRLFRVALVACMGVLGGIGWANPAGAQASGVPVWSPGIPHPLYSGALQFAAHATSGDDFLGDTGAELGMTLTGRWSFVSRVTVAAGLGFARRDVAPGERTERLHYFISAAVTPVVWRDAVNPIEAAVSVVSGIGLNSLPGSSDERNIPAGVNVSLSFGMGGWFIEPWVQPRWHWRRTAVGLESQWQNGFGGTVGLTIAWTTWSLAFAGDYVHLGAADTGAPVLPDTQTFAGSLGLRYAF